MAIITIVFVAVFRFVVEYNIRGMGPSGPDVLLQAMADSLVFYTTSYFIFSAILLLLIPGRPSGIPAVVSLGLLFGVAPPILERAFPSLAGEYYDYMFEWQVFFYDPSFQPLAETITVWGVISLVGLFVGIVTNSVLRGLSAFLLAWLGLAWLGVIVPSALFDDPAPSLLEGRWKMSLAFLVTSIALFHVLRFRAHWPCLRRMNHALPFGGLAFCGAAFAGFGTMGTAGRVALILYLCLVLLLHNDFYDRQEDLLAARDTSSDASDVIASTWLTVLALLTISRFAPMIAMCASGMLLLGFAYHHPAFRLKENFCLSYMVEGGWALSAFCTGVSGWSLFRSDQDLAWPALVVFGGGALLSIPKDWKDVESDRRAGIPTIYVQAASSPAEELRVHHGVVLAVGAALVAAPLVVWTAYGFSAWLPVLLAATVLVLMTLRESANRRRGVERYMGLLGCWLFAAGLLLRDVLG